VGVAAGRRGQRLVDGLRRAGAHVASASTFEAVAATSARVRAETGAVLERSPAGIAVTTAEGLGWWVDAAGPLRADLLSLLSAAGVTARGAGTTRALAAVGVPTAVTAASGRGTEVARLLMDRASPGATLAVQVDGGGSPALVGWLVGAGYDVPVVRPHRWRPPADGGPARRLVRQLVAGDLDLVAFTAAPAVDGLFEAAADLGRDGALAEALGAAAVAAMGPVTAEALEARGVRVTVCPAQPTVEALVAAVATWRMLPVAATPLALDPAGRAVRRDGRCVPLTDLEFSLLASLSRRPGLVCPTPVLLREVWGQGDRRRLEVLVSRLRSRLTPLDLSITAVPKRGYRLE
jgi:uroporphyrinogen-III synthase